jgi:hypothetical protein
MQSSVCASQWLCSDTLPPCSEDMPPLRHSYLSGSRGYRNAWLISESIALVLLLILFAPGIYIDMVVSGGMEGIEIDCIHSFVDEMYLEFFEHSL